MFGPISLRKQRVWIVGLKRILVPFDPFWFILMLEFVKQILAPRIVCAVDFLGNQEHLAWHVRFPDALSESTALKLLVFVIVFKVFKTRMHAY